jgi:hypothetical protein
LGYLQKISQGKLREAIHDIPVAENPSNKKLPKENRSGHILTGRENIQRKKIIGIKNKRK